MYALSISCYSGYREDWTEEGLRIRYHGERSYEAVLSEGEWHFSCEDEDTRRYLLSAAVIEKALKDCLSFGFSPLEISEFLPSERESLLPAELLRRLLDDLGLEIQEACQCLLDCFGVRCFEPYDGQWLCGIQPRCAALCTVLTDSLSYFGFAYHDAYSESFRSPLAAIEEQTELRLFIRSANSINEAWLSLDGLEHKMQRVKDGFELRICPDRAAAASYRFRLVHGVGEAWLCASSDGHLSRLSSEAGEGFRLTVYKRGFNVPEWFSKCVMYQIFPDRFGFSDGEQFKQGIEYHRSLGREPLCHESLSEPVCYLPRNGAKDYEPDDFYGGCLEGVIKKLPYLSSLGVSVVYLNPIFESPSNHRYDCSDYTKIDPILGTNEDFVRLCHEAEGFGISVILDGVFSHTGADSVYFNRFGSYPEPGAYESRNSRFFPWYDFRSFPDDYRAWWGFKSLPETNEENPDWQSFIISSEDSIVRRWLRLGASGWRLDVADELPDEVLAMIRSAAKKQKPESVIIGEVWEDAVTKESYGKKRDYALGYSLDSVMNYPFRRAVLSFAKNELSSFELRDFLLSQAMNYPPPMYRSLMNLLGSHDVERLHTALGKSYDVNAADRAVQAELKLSEDEDRLATMRQRLCAVIQYSVPGVPCLYYGDEDCLDGCRDPFNRAAFEPQKSGLFELYARLGRLRRENAALSMGEMSLSCPKPDVLLIFRRHESLRLCSVINRGNEPFPLPFAAKRSLLGTSSTQSLPPMSADVFEM